MIFFDRLVGKGTMSEKEKILKFPSDWEECQRVAKALSSKTRAQIIGLVMSHEKMNISEIAASLSQTEANISAQVKILEKVGILKPEYAPGKHGISKNVLITVDRLAIDFNGDYSESLIGRQVPAHDEVDSVHSEMDSE